MKTMLIPLVTILMANLGGAPAGVPPRQPQLAAGNGMVAMVFGKGNSVMFTRSNDNGRTFSQAVKVADVPVLALSRHRGPRVVVSGANILVSATGGSTPATGEHAHGLATDGNLAVWRSGNGGRTWTKPVLINDALSSATEGLHAMAADGHGQVAAAWLDLRGQGTKLYGAFSRDNGVTWSRNVLLYESKGGTICQCCDPSLAASGPGDFKVMFRDVRGGSRDMYLMSIHDGRVVSSPVKVGMGSWKINACPMDGGGLAVANGETIRAWRRESDVFLTNGGAKEIRLGSGTDVALDVSGSRIAVMWTKAGRIQAWIGSNGHNGRVETFAENGGGFPSLVGLPNGESLSAWEQNGTIETHILSGN